VLRAVALPANLDLRVSIPHTLLQQRQHMVVLLTMPVQEGRRRSRAPSSSGCCTASIGVAHG
jgi:hypothetical protein